MWLYKSFTHSIIDRYLGHFDCSTIMKTATANSLEYSTVYGEIIFYGKIFFKKLPCFGVADVRYINLQIRFASITIKMCDNSSYCTSLMKSNVWIFLANLLRVYWYIIMVFICSSLMIRLSTFSKVYLT